MFTVITLMVTSTRIRGAGENRRLVNSLITVKIILTTVLAISFVCLAVWANRWVWSMSFVFNVAVISARLVTFIELSTPTVKP